MISEGWLYYSKWVAAICTLISTWLFYSLSRKSENVARYDVRVPSLPADKVIAENSFKKEECSTEIPCYAPATGAFLGLIRPQTNEDIDLAILESQKAQNSWAQTTFKQRKQVLQSIETYVLEHQEEISRIACLDSGKTMIDATLGEILVTVEKLRWTHLHGEKALRPSKRPTNLLMAYKNNYVIYEPLGVVAALISWNYPFHNLIGPIISAIFAGNGIIVKASEHTAWSAAYFTQIVKGALQVCGHCPNLVQTVVTWPHTANYLTSHPGISHVTFIGSRPVAKLVAASAAKSLTPIIAELGGKDAAIILDSAKTDLPRIIEIILRGTFQAAGQNCIGIERCIACPNVYNELTSALEVRIKAIRVGSTLDASKNYQVDMGAMISDVSFERLEKLIEAAVNDGARLLVGGHRFRHPLHTNGKYFEPTLIVDVTPNMAISNEECFGPICVVMRARDVEEACNYANQPSFGLGASVFGAEGVEVDTVVRKIKSGMVAVNDFAAYYAVQLPFGGVAKSGYGRFAGKEGLRGLCNLKAVCRDRWGWLGIRTSIPNSIRYPVYDTDKGYKFIKAVVMMGYGVNLGEKFSALWELWKNC